MSNSRATVPTPDLYLCKSQFSASWNVQLTVFHCHLYRSSPFVYTFPFCGPTRATFKENWRKKKEVRLPYPSTNRYFSLNFRHFSTSLVCSYRLYECFVTGVFFFFRLKQWKNCARIKFWEQMIRSLLIIISDITELMDHKL